MSPTLLALHSVTDTHTRSPSKQSRVSKPFRKQAGETISSPEPCWL